MNSTGRISKEHFLTVDAEMLASMLNCGRQTAAKIGTDANARIQVGRRVLYSVPAIEKYLDQIRE